MIQKKIVTCGTLFCIGERLPIIVSGCEAVKDMEALRYPDLAPISRKANALRLRSRHVLRRPVW
ncbi:hypothetical protein WPS_27690 [Vulcanimicrobium alpinum]|uniref:Uncharacterized protein n=1 Tax=Vulcanimicrobium alpinum TaxID=3016050 RepID=A0AAN1XZU8_UNVUL|nr:hypothetical protein WPS_27690 [Vulcanimicrobium alpinum]